MSSLRSGFIRQESVAGIKTAEDAYSSSYLNSLQPGNNWDLNNLKTIVNWLNLSSLYIVMLNHSIEYYSHIINTVTFWSLVLSTIASTVSVSHFSVTDTTYPNASLGLKIALTIASVFATVLTGYVKISKAKENLEEAMRYQNRWMLFATELSSQLQLPVQMRTNAIRVIINSKDQFKQLFNTRFVIPDTVKTQVAELLETDALRERAFKEEVAKRKEKPDPSGNSVTPPVKECQWFHKKKDQDIDYIYDSNRLNIYFIFKDLIYNEIKNFELYMRSTGQLGKNKRLKFAMTPSRIIINTVHSSVPDQPSFNDLGLGDSSMNRSQNDSDAHMNIIQKLDMVVAEMNDLHRYVSEAREDQTAVKMILYDQQKQLSYLLKSSKPESKPEAKPNVVINTELDQVIEIESLVLEDQSSKENSVLRKFENRYANQDENASEEIQIEIAKLESQPSSSDSNS